MAIFGERLKLALQNKNMKQSVLAYRLNVDRSYITNWINGKYNPTPETQERIADILGVSRGWLLGFEEKPQHTKSNYAVVGLYFYPNKVVEVAKGITPSARGELEITTVNQRFLADKELKAQTLGRGFAWLDTGTHESLSEASTYIETIEKRQGLKIACLEEIAYHNGWITREKLVELAQPMLKNQYGQYLLKIAKEGTSYE